MKNSALLIVVSTFFLVFLTICILLDAQNRNSESITMVYISIINVIVMSFLTYLLLETTRQNNEINEKLITLTKFEIEDRKKREFYEELNKIKYYRRQLNILQEIAIPYININHKYDLLLELKNSKLLFNNHLYLVDKSILEKLPDKSELRKYKFYPYTSKDDNYQVVNEVFKDAININICHKTLDESLVAYGKLIKIFNDDFFNRYLNIRQIISMYKTPLEKHTVSVFNDNKKFASICALQFDTMDADGLYNTINSLSTNLSDLEVHIQNKLNDLESL